MALSYSDSCIDEEAGQRLFEITCESTFIFTEFCRSLIKAFDWKIIFQETIDKSDDFDLERAIDNLIELEKNADTFRS